MGSVTLRHRRTLRVKHRQIRVIAVHIISFMVSSSVSQGAEVKLVLSFYLRPVSVLLFLSLIMELWFVCFYFVF